VRGQIWYIALLIGLMCMMRFSLSAVGYAAPHWLMEQLSIAATSNVQMPYVVRVWAIRDIVLAVLVAFAHQQTVKPLLLACLVIDTTDIVSAYLSSAAGLFNAAETGSLQLAAILALIPELIALVLLTLPKPQAQIGSEKKLI
jgi:hypothetical protein